MKNIPKQSATLTQIVDFYLHSETFRRLSSSSQKDYETHLQATVLTEVEGKTEVKRQEGGGREREV